MVKGEPGTKFPTTPPGPIVAAAAKPPRVGLEFPARSSALFAERNFPGHSGGQVISTLLEWAARETAGACGEGTGKLGKLKMGILKLGK